MKKLVIFIIMMTFAIIPFFAMADNNGESTAGRLFLFQKCDESLIGNPDYPNYDASGCPNIGTGPWPIFPDNNRWGILNYSLWGDKFKFSFSGRGLLPGTNYTLIYYPDPWPGNGLICLGSGHTPSSKGKGKGHAKSGNQGNGKWKQQGRNLNIHGDVDIHTSLPIATDANYNPVGSSGAVGAKIWLVQSEDVQCTKGASMMLNWNPAAYLFEYNLIVFGYRPADSDDDDDD